MMDKIIKCNCIASAGVLVVVFVVAVLCAQETFGAVTEDQMYAAGNMMRDVCAKKFPKVSKETADGIRAGNIPDDKDAKCYINCILEMMQTIKKGKFNYEASLKQVDMLLPDEYKDEYRAGLATCKDAAVGVKNNCDAAFTLLTCLRNQITKFIFP